jgi:hypothetical protein
VDREDVQSIACPLGLDGALNLAKKCPCKTRRTIRTPEEDGGRHPIRVLACLYPFTWDRRRLSREYSELVSDWANGTTDEQHRHVVKVNDRFYRVPFGDDVVRAMIGDYPGLGGELRVNDTLLQALDCYLDGRETPAEPD